MIQSEVDARLPVGRIRGIEAGGAHEIIAHASTPWPRVHMKLEGTI
jgi:hypothetical protein